jgi:DNA (cytosine-5)-methyltransferase 1
MLVCLDEMGYDVEWQVFNSKDFIPQNRERIFIIGHLRDKPTPKVFPITEIDQVDDGSCGKAQKKGKRVRGEYSNCLCTGQGRGSKQYVNTIDANYAKGRGSRTMIMISNINANMSNRMQERDETWTLTTKRMEFGIVEGSKIRSLTPLECERLQGFPEGWTEGVSDTQRYKQLGNAVTVPVIEEIARRFTD